MRKLTKTNIEKLAMEIATFLEKNGIADSVSIYFNNKVMRNKGKYDDDYNYISKWETTEDIDPHDYFEYAAYEHILSMSFEGKLYEVLNYGPYIWEEQFNKLFEKYGVYFELGDAWNLTCYTCDDDTEVEYTRYKKPKEKIELYYFRRYEAPTELRAIMEHWYELSTQTGDIGSCVLGAGFNFEYQDNEYFMDACSPYQGSISWEQHKDDIQKMLEDIGATKIYYKWGNMD
jgi:hypothetical protein